MGRDRPADEVEKVARKFLSSIDSAARLGFAKPARSGQSSSAGPSSGGPPASAALFDPTFRLYAPWKLTSCVHLRFGNVGFGRAILRELRDKCKKGLYKVYGQEYKFYATQQKSLEERTRNKKLVAIAQTIQKYLKEGEPDRTAEPWTMVCWRIPKIICGGLRRAGLERDDTTVTFLPEWWTNATFTQPPDVIRKAVMEEVALCDA